ncbi:MAG: glycosyltransferase family 39 protein [Vicinamibacteria bacterium]|nr:glycosyltransferase family 39 protein [Vicinamibacteria bacterium]
MIAPAMEQGKWTGLGLPLALAAPVLLVLLGVAPLQRAEVYFLDAARAMLETGDWAVPRFRSEPFFDKPPLLYWLFGAAFAALGTERVAARVVSVAAALLAIGLTRSLGRRFFGAAVGDVAALVLATTPGFLAMGRLAMADMVLTALCLAAVALGAAAAERGEDARGQLLASGAVLGLAFLAKGPVALLFALVPLAALGPALMRPRAAAWIAAGFVPIAVPWFAWLALTLGTAPLEHFFWRENVARFATDAYASGRGPLYYVGVYLTLGLPWALLLPLGLRGLASAPAAARVAAAVVVALLPLSLSRGKIEYYLLPLYPWLALLVARGLVAANWDRLSRGLARLACALPAISALALAAIAPRLPAPWALAPLEVAALVGATLLASAALGAAALRPEPARVGVAMAGGVALVGPVLVATFLAATWEVRPQAELVRRIVAELAREPGTGVVVCHDAAHVERALLFDHRIVVRHACELAAPGGAGPAPLLVLHDDDLARFSADASLEVLAREPFLPAKAFQRALLGESVTPRFVVLARPRPGQSGSE